MIVTWTDDNGITHTGSAEGRAYKRHKAEQAKAAARPSEPVGTVESGLIRAIPEPLTEAAAPAAEAAPAVEPAAVSEPTAETEPRKRSR
ncbi:hypothetical protein [Nocardia africana]|uniref:Uncharacterized protein n=1 Tax=Nocardia africana TaxID=134964 RepID=A0A378X3I5_9NOCA|nr:hypothetical protein [Nocardia africana]MCC3311527.1 hypothetical protein [Nocardia africana]SUA47211.1 Uncharacterised protein [Nocardia africana]